jgi:hypothetical protein
MVKVKMICPHGREELNEFLLHVNSIHVNIQFTMEAEGLEKMATFPSWKKEARRLLGTGTSRTDSCQCF